MIAEGLDRVPAGGEQAFRRHFDPCDKFPDTAELVRVLIEKRSEPVDIALPRGIGQIALGEHDGAKWQLAGKNLLAAEVVLLDITLTDQSKEAIMSILGMDHQQYDEVLYQITQETDRVAEEITGLIDRIIKDPTLCEQYTGELGTRIDGNTPPVVVAGLLMAYWSHEGKTRQNEDKDSNKRSYYSHPLATAFLYQMAWDEVSEDLKAHDGTVEVNGELKRVEIPDRKWLERQIFVDLMHDTFEDQLRKDGGSFMQGTSFRVAPLLMRKVLEKLGLSQQEARHIVDDVVLVTKTRGVEGESLDPRLYVRRCTRSIRAMIAKFCDTVHNKLIDTKQDREGREKTELEYGIMLDAIQQAINHGTHDEFGLLTLQKIRELVDDDTTGFLHNHDRFMEVAGSRRLPLGQL